MEKNNEFKPFIPANEHPAELTVLSIILGIILAIIFGGANAYLGLRVGLTVSASIPAAVISMGVIRMILKRDSILENNMVQTIGSAGESIAAGAIFTLPALFMWAHEGADIAISLFEITSIVLVGGLLGVFFMIPLRRALIVKEHGVLPYPEGTACAEVLAAGEEGGSKAGLVFKGLGIAAVYKIIADGFKLFPSEVDYSISSYKGAGIGMDVLPALLGVGYICGMEVSALMFAGGILAWFVLMPLIALFGGSMILFPGTVPIADMDTWAIWNNYIRYIGAGAVAAGGIISLVKSLPLIISTFSQALKGISIDGTAQNDRTAQDLSPKVLMIGIVLLVVAMWLLPTIPIGLLGAIIVLILGFFFATVSSRMVGVVGSSNNPVSGMTIAALLIATFVLKASGSTGVAAMVAAITIGGIICVTGTISGDASQDLKTGYIVGATPKKQQIGEIIGVVAASITIGGILYLLDAAWGYGSAELPAPQATLMKMVIEGVLQGNLPWSLVFVGVGIAVTVEVLGIPVLPFAIGLYLPIHLSTPLMAGGVVRYLSEKRSKSEKETKAKTNNGILFASGLIAGEGLLGIILALFAVITIGGKSIGEYIDLSSRISLGNLGGLVFFGILIAIFVHYIHKGVPTDASDASADGNDQ